MRSDVDHRLVRLLRASLGLVDTLRDLGVAGEIAVKLDRDDGLQVLQAVAGGRDGAAEAFSQRNRPVSHELNSLVVAGVTFQWPRRHAPREMRALNDNRAVPVRPLYEDETPALR